MLARRNCTCFVRDRNFKKRVTPARRVLSLDKQPFFLELLYFNVIHWFF